MRQWRELDLSPIASARSRPSSAAAHRDRVTGGDRCARLPGQDLAEPPPIVQRPGEFDRLGEVLLCQLGVVGGRQAAGGERPGEHGSVLDVAREHQGLLRPIQAVGGGRDRVKHRYVGQRPGAYRGRHFGVLRDLVGEDSVEPRQPFPDASSRLPKRQQRRRQRQGQLDVRVLATPPKRGPQIVDLDFGLLETLLIITACRRIDQQPPAPCSGRGDVTARRRPRRIRRAFPGRTGAPSPTVDSAFGLRCPRRPPVTCRRAG